ncbi:large ribosomal subunit protein mL62 isoform X1 [Dermatophagoides pteronyssinus]|uniref:large ribosomal subunit protein mL62 isoform X1 n=1 Tax=Dermatophagoides pteronyssinus TaxID=6956 RepID=UPI003F682152
MATFFLRNCLRYYPVNGRLAISRLPQILQFHYTSFRFQQQQEESFINNSQFTGYIPINQLDISYCTSSGPGGQNVNRNFTKVTVKLHLPTANWIPDDIKDRITELHKNSINKDGYWLIRSDKTRQQLLNVADCMDKLRCYIAEAAKPPNLEPSFETLEKQRQDRERASIRRLEMKKQRSIFKAQKRMEF